MSKILAATCSATGIVSADGVTVPAAVKMGQGAQSSSGLLIMDGDKAYYLPSETFSDLVTTILHIIDLITATAEGVTQIATTLTSIGAGMTGPTTAPPPTLATDVAIIGTKVTLLNATKSQLNTLKAALK